jgi:hypothetical protein
MEVQMGRSKRLGLVLSEKEKSLVVALAKLEGELSQAALIRMLIYQAASNNGLLTLNDHPVGVQHSVPFVTKNWTASQ